MTVQRKLVTRLFLAALIFSALSLLLHSCMTFRMSKRELDRYLQTHRISASRQTIQVDGRPIHYITTTKEDGPLIVFIHGSPGSLSNFIQFFTDTALTQRARLITIDRPGFGYSSFGIGERSLTHQALLLMSVVKQYANHEPVILVGHSLGGAIIARMAMDYPELIDGLVFVAASVDPHLEPNEAWFRAPLASPFLRWAVPASIRASNEELYHLKQELEKMMPLWGRITCCSVVIQGKKDFLVPYGNAEFAKQQLVNAPVSVILRDEVGHFIPWSNPDLIKEGIERVLRKCEKREP